MSLALGAAAATFLIVWRHTSEQTRFLGLLRAIAAGGLVFQVVHVLEHLLQFGFWITQPGERPWLSSWAGGTADALAYFCGLIDALDRPSVGVEMLHLTGNLIFLGALAAWQMHARLNRRPVIRSLDRAELVQRVHVIEHILLVTTLLILGTPDGLSTAFGLVEGQGLVALRVCFHFGINAVATTFAVHAAIEERRWHHRFSAVDLNLAVADDNLTDLERLVIEVRQ